MNQAERLYVPSWAWLRALIYFALCLLVARGCGVLALLQQQSVVSASQLQDPLWRVLGLSCLAVVGVAYGLIWPKGTFTDGRRARPLLAGLYGLCWGICQGLLFLSIWQLVQASGLATLWVGLISYALIGVYNGLLHHHFWDVYVSPPHNYSEWNLRKVVCCHTPNLMLCLSFYGLFCNAALFVLLQGLALALSAIAMRFPAPWDDYRAPAGQERSLSQEKLLST